MADINQKKKTINLDLISDVLGNVKINEKEYNIPSPSTETVERAAIIGDQIKQSKLDTGDKRFSKMIEKFKDTIILIVPDLPREVLDKLTFNKLVYLFNTVSDVAMEEAGKNNEQSKPN